LTIEQVGRYFFRGVDPSAPFRRVRKLIAVGLLAIDPNLSLGRRRILRLTSLGLKTAEVGYWFHIPPARRINPALLAHEELVGSVRLRLAEFWDGRFVPERAIRRREFAQIPDGIFYFRSGRGIALEVENSPKGKTRFIRLLQRWKRVDHIACVLFVVATPELEDRLRTYLPFAPPDQPVGLVRWDRLESGHPLIWTPRGELDLLGRKEF
jgi:hypothetical protein